MARYMKVVMVPNSMHIGVVRSIYIDIVCRNVLGRSCGVQGC